VQPADLNAYATDAELTAGLATKADASHSHTIADTTGLQTALDGKAATSHTHTGVYAPALGADDNYVTDAEKAALHTHPAVIAQGATQAAARTAIGAGTSSFSGAYADLTGKPTTMTPTAHAATHAAAGSDPVSVTSAQISDLTEAVQDIVGVVSLDRYPRLGNETNDAPRFTRALADMAADSTLRVLQLGAGTYTLTSSVSVDVDGITVRGAGIRATVISVEADVIGSTSRHAHIRQLSL
jgi:hypothetical protein